MIWQHTWKMYTVKDLNYKPFNINLLVISKFIYLSTLLLPEIGSDGIGLSRMAAVSEITVMLNTSGSTGQFYSCKSISG